MKAKICTIVGMAITACALFAASTPDGARWWSYVEFFASDKLEGLVRTTSIPAVGTCLEEALEDARIPKDNERWRQSRVFY